MFLRLKFPRPILQLANYETIEKKKDAVLVKRGVSIALRHLLRRSAV